MRSPKTAFALVALIALAGVGASARADDSLATSAQQEVVVVATQPGNCDGNSPADSRRLAKEAEKSGAHQRAAECYLVAGDNLRAHRAMLHMAADSAAASKRNASTAAESAKSQVRRIRAAFR